MHYNSGRIDWLRYRIPRYRNPLHCDHHPISVHYYKTSSSFPTLASVSLLCTIATTCGILCMFSESLSCLLWFRFDQRLTHAESHCHNQFLLLINFNDDFLTYKTSDNPCLLMTHSNLGVTPDLKTCFDCI